MTNISKYDFGSQFIETKGQPIEFNGKQIVMIDPILAKLNEEFVATIKSTNSPHIQVIGITEGVEVFGEKNMRAVIFAEDRNCSAPARVSPGVGSRQLIDI